MEIREIGDKDLEEALELIREVFMEFEAPEYEEKGVREFLNYVEIDSVKKRIENEGLRLWGAFTGGAVTGVIAIRSGAHISLLFVKKEFHRQGIARCLFERVKEECASEGFEEITVNSSPYAKEAYARLGFKTVSEEQTVNGIRFIPMVYHITEGL